MTVRSKNQKRLEKAKSLYKAGKSQKEIAQIIGITEKTAGRWLKPFKTQIKQSNVIKANVLKQIKKATETNQPDNAKKWTAILKDLQTLL